MTAVRNGGSAVVDALVSEGVTDVFGIPGTHSLELYRALAARGLRHVTTRSEQGAGYAADGYARTTGRPGVCLVTSGPAVNNVAAPVGTAHADSVPLLVVAPGPPRGLEGADVGELHEMRDQRGHMAAVAERAVRASSPEEAAAAVHESFAHWRTHRQRPHFLEVPLDVLTGAWDGEDPGPLTAPAHPGPDAGDLALAAGRLAGAERPALLVGRGAVAAADGVRALAELLGAPVVTTVNGKGVLPERHPLSVGASVRLAPAQRLLTDADVVLVVGTALSDAEVWGWAPDLPGTTIRVDVEAGQLSKRLTPTVGLHGDAATVLPRLAELLAPDAPPRRDGPARAQRAREDCAGAAAPEAGPWAGLNRALAAALPPETIVAGDSSQVTYYGTAHFWPVSAPAQLLYPTVYATLGYGLPAAIGAGVGAPGRPVVALVGDGALMFSLAELATAVEQRLPLPVVVVNDHGYTEIRDGMRRAGIPPFAVDLHTPDFAAVGRAVGARGVSARSVEDAVAAVVRALDADGPSVVEVDAGALAAAAGTP
ncbi:acetolactate synthase-1/2/3 large subunit [Geodermatophilus bullaregiensis]|uniref:thiamine pyrophosphate-binding protein n=1 Tax=Geodermatophilus bullaregiensis TaxID=1564160 RepID=UPI00195D7986|nr:thiamine pyrophosphate-binding protein [Geodermatophilus bullaregiensis]MBM7805054.1 acetolactate synthase-1/2/3 large subunit [Geodermatophilus bullaregiensis]